VTARPTSVEAQGLLALVPPKALRHRIVQLERKLERLAQKAAPLLLRAVALRYSICLAKRALGEKADGRCGRHLLSFQGAIVDLCIQLLRDNGRPMRIYELRDQLAARGALIPGVGRAGGVERLSHYLRRSGRVVQTAKGTYALVEAEKLSRRREK
jgi:hypothetical protein